MNKLIRMTSLAATVAALTLTATPAIAANPDKNATATARVVKPLVLTWVQDLDLGTIVLSGAGAWSGATVGISAAGAFDCTDANVTCSGATQVARYTVTGTNNQVVTVSAPDVTLVNQNDNTQTLNLAVDAPASINLGNSGAAGYDLDLGGSITVDSTTADGTYVGTFNVTVNY